MSGTATGGGKGQLLYMLEQIQALYCQEGLEYAGWDKGDACPL